MTKRVLHRNGSIRPNCPGPRRTAGRVGSNVSPPIQRFQRKVPLLGTGGDILPHRKSTNPPCRRRGHDDIAPVGAAAVNAIQFVDIRNLTRYDPGSAASLGRAILLVRAERTTVAVGGLVEPKSSSATGTVLRCALRWENPADGTEPAIMPQPPAWRGAPSVIQG